MVSSCTRIPVPRIWTHFVWDERRYIVMSRVRGVELSSVWRTAGTQFKEAVAAQLANHFKELRTLRTPYGSRICSILGGPVRDFRLQYRHTGPFEDEDDFNHHGARFNHDIEFLPADMQELVAAAHSIKHDIVFTHGDLALRNIMVDGATVTAIVDWECAGWFPEHWEYCKSIFAAEWGEERDPWLRRALPVYDLEAEADSMLVRHLWRPLV
ncbi:hypothetical protein EVJ58_g5183 [Rhodofomes roseus]|uniref:Aminoglycoside phosphotransferase domain-containing protein n=1 Tax=Rhodofomes roseus TaxID=34475 RepID=A0A4Y9YDW6_9APHY|nr:hypothetical protein EVJ58_g5183 [Rhodofomes roseus]